MTPCSSVRSAARTCTAAAAATCSTSILDKLLILDDNTVVLPGHGNATTIGAERRHNPFLEGLSA